ncbi:beta-defensin 39-like [Podarcis raffonei]|uniref:beta-defensin 39-like n=1 Tax=Podarcis raffonei TaxID=65483 RepID=UPI00232926E4|nr:beta-defensin 39-like [Podarcis raffonei]
MHLGLAPLLNQLATRIMPSLFLVAFLLLCTLTPGHSHARDTLKCHEDKGTCHPTLCPAQKIEKGSCYDGIHLCCVDCPSHFLSYEGNGGFSTPRFGLRASIKLLLSL